MKLSNQILIGFFGFLFLYMTAIFAEVRFRGTPYIIDDSNSIAERVKLPETRFLVVRDIDRYIHIEKSDTSTHLEVRSISGAKLQNLKYRVSGDTVTLLGLDDDDKNSIRVTVFVSANRFEGVTIDGAAATIRNLDMDNLKIAQNRGWIRISDCEFKRLEVKASQQSYFECFSTAIDTLTLTMESSQLSVWSTVRRLEGSITNGASLRLQQAEEIEFRKDETSNLYLYR